MKYFIYIVIIVVAVAVISGFFIVGSPGEERLRRFDERRIEDLQSLQSEIVNFWQRKEILPQTLVELEDSIRGITVPRDPGTGEEYEYNIISKGNLTFELCAVFSRPSLDLDTEISSKPVPIRAPGEFVGENWQHSQGRTCFERTIDPDLYKPLLEPVR